MFLKIIQLRYFALHKVEMLCNSVLRNHWKVLRRPWIWNNFMIYWTWA